MRNKTRGRMLAVQALYQLDLRAEDFLSQMGKFIAASAPDEETRVFAEELAYGCIETTDELDACIAASTEHWDITRMAAVDRAIIRLATYELTHCPDVPPKVAVNEAIILAKKLSTAESGAFVNGILDKIMATHTRPRSGED